MKIYLINHRYDTDGGFGDAISQEDVVKITTDKELAEKYVKKWSKPYIYAEPYDSLYEHELVIREMEVNNFSLDDEPTERWNAEEEDF